MSDEACYLDFGQLRQFALDNREVYGAAEPFPHIMIEDFICKSKLRPVLDSFPSPEQSVSWRKTVASHTNGEYSQHGKLGLPHETQLSPAIRGLIWELNSSTFVRFLENLTGIKGLIPDPCIQGGGVHQILPGGVLGIHADFTEHRIYKLSRRINVLIYLNEVWEDEYEGLLELWNRDMSHCVRRIKPLLGRCVIFSTSDDSFHGHPEPLACPKGMTRKSLALYYYTNGAADGVNPTLATDWHITSTAHRPSPE